MALTRRRAEADFLDGCQAGNLHVVKDMLALTGPLEVNAHVNDEEAYWVACANGHLEVVKHLMSLQGARFVDVHARFDRGLRAAVQFRHWGVLRLLLQQEGRRCTLESAVADMAFRAACEHGKLDIVQLLLVLPEAELDVNWDRTAFRKACENGHTDVVALLLGLRKGRAINAHADHEAPLRGAARNGHSDTVALLVRQAQAEGHSLTSMAELCPAALCVMLREPRHWFWARSAAGARVLTSWYRTVQVRSPDTAADMRAVLRRMRWGVRRPAVLARAARRRCRLAGAHTRL